MLPNLSKIQEQRMTCDGPLKRCNAPEFKQNSRTPFVTCDGFIKKMQSPEFKQNSKTLYLTCDGSFREMQCSRISVKFKNTVCDM